jgi:Transcriptional regulator PadR-like family
MLILAHLADRPAHGDEIKKHVERTLGGSPAINNLLYPALHVTLRSATTWRTLPRCRGLTSAPGTGLGHGRSIS